MKFVIEHLEPRLWKWCILEYKHISEIAGKKNLIFTNVKTQDKAKLQKFGRVYSRHAYELNLKRICILDPSAEKTLTPRDAKKFDYFVFGGILGDYPPQKRTKKRLFLEGERRNLRKKQMATDNAVYVTRMICRGIALEKLKFKDKLKIKTGEGEEVLLPFRYVLVKGKPLISEDVIGLIKMKGF